MDRTFHNVTGDVTYSDSGLFTFPLDRIGLSYLKQSMPMLSRSATLKCDDVPYCGWPLYFPVIYFTHFEYVTVDDDDDELLKLSVRPLLQLRISHECANEDML